MLPPTVGYEKHDATRKRNPAYSMGVKAPMDLKKPGPAPYNLRQNQTRFGNCYSPAYSIGARTGIPGLKSLKTQLYSPKNVIQT